MRMLVCVDLGEAARFRDILRMAVDTERRNIRQHGFYRSWILRVFSQGAVARFAVNASVSAFRFDLQNIGVATLTNLMPRVR